MPQRSNAGESENSALEQSETFGDQLRAKESGPRNIPAWPRQADDQFIADGIGHTTHNDRDCSGCLFGGASWRRTYHDDDVDLQPNQIDRQLLETIRIPIPIASLDRYV
jgi:hypothetical protein